MFLFKVKTKKAVSFYLKSKFNPKYEMNLQIIAVQLILLAPIVHFPFP